MIINKSEYRLNESSCEPPHVSTLWRKFREIQFKFKLREKLNSMQAYYLFYYVLLLGSKSLQFTGLFSNYNESRAIQFLLALAVEMHETWYEA